MKNIRMFKMCAALQVFVIMVITAAATETTTWTGTNSENWHDAGNWDAGVPGSTTNAIIPGSLSNFPNITAAATVNNLSLLDGAHLRDNGNLTIHGTFTMQREGLKIPYDWRMISAPVSDMTIVGSDFVPIPDDWGVAGSRTFDFYAFNETITGTNGNPALPWVNIRAGGTVNNAFDIQFQQGKGYLVAYTNNYPVANFQFNGTMNTGDVTVNLTDTPGSDLKNRGWNLIGNPYPSGYHWHGADYSNLITDFIYRYDYRIGNYMAYENNVIPPNQGFFVKTTEGGGVLTFLDANRVNAGIFIKSEEPTEAIVLAFGTEGRKDHATIRIIENASFGSDRRDAFKLFSFSKDMPQIFTKAADDERMAVNSIPWVTEETVIPVGLYVPETGTYSITLEEASGRFAGMDVVLFDRETETEMLLSTAVQVDFYADASGEDPGLPRFGIRFRATGEPTGTYPEDAPMARIYSHENILTVEFSGPDPKRLLEVVDLNGRLLMQQQLEHVTMFRQPLDLLPGVYIVRVSDTNSTQTGRIIIR